MNTQYPNNIIFDEFLFPKFILIFIFSKNGNEFYYLHYNGNNTVNNWILRINDKYNYYWVSLNKDLHINTISDPILKIEKEYHEALEKIKKYTGLL